MDWITDSIAIGNIEDAMDLSRLRESGVTGVLCLNGFPSLPRHHGFAWSGMTLIDGPGNSIEEIHAAVQELRTLTESHRVMVHCAEGLSRSALVVACYLAEQHAMPLETAIEQVTERRPRAFIDRALLALIEHQWPPLSPASVEIGSIEVAPDAAS